MCWSFEEKSFWRGKSVAMSEVVSYAKSMALTRFREAGGLKSACQFPVYTLDLFIFSLGAVEAPQTGKSYP